MVCKCTYIWFQKIYLLVPRPSWLYFLKMPVFSCKKLEFFDKNGTFTQSNSVRAVLVAFYFWFLVFLRKKVTINENVVFTDYGSGIRLPDCSKLAINWKNDNGVTIRQHDVIVILFDVVLFLLSSLVTGTSFMSISPMVLEFWQFSFIDDWLEIRKLDAPPSDCCPTFGDWDKLEIPDLTRMSLIKYG